MPTTPVGRGAAGRSRRALLAQVRHPTPDRDGGSSRTLDLAEALQGMDFHVTFCAIAPEDGWQRYARLLEQAGVEVRNGIAAVTEDLAAGAFEVAAITFWPAAELLAPVVAELAPQTAIVVHSGDLHVLRTTRRSAVAGAGLDAQAGDDFIREINAYLLADRVVVVSEAEAQVARQLVGDHDRFAVVPLSEPAVPAPLPLSKRRGLLFVGNFRHVPNLEAAVHLCDVVLPHLDRHLLARHPLTVIGQGLDEPWYAEVKAAVTRLPGVRLPGWVPDVSPYVGRARLSVAPLLHGAGVKGKVLTSLAAGTPVVTTPVGAEGLGPGVTAALTMADEPFALALAVERLLTDDDLWSASAALGPPAVAQEHGRPAIVQRLQHVVADAIASVPRRREPRGSLASFAAGAHRERARLLHEAVDHLGEATAAVIGGDGDVLVICDGDQGLLDIPGRTTRAFPVAAEGSAGFRPVSGTAAVSHLRSQIDRGARYLVVPAPSLSWLHHYPELAAFLDDDGGACLLRSELGRVYRLPPIVPDRGVVVAAVPQAVADRLAAAPPATCTVEARLWRGDVAAPFDHLGDAKLVVAVREGAQLPPGFWDRLAAAVAEIPFDVLQPAFIPGSGAPPAYEAQGGVLARAMPTLDEAPVLAARPPAVRWLTGGGIDADRPPTTAVLDAVPVGLEPSAVEKLRRAADARLTMTAVVSHGHGPQALPRRTVRPEISVVIATYQRAELLAGCLESFAAQDAPAGSFEVVVVDDGSGPQDRARALAVVEGFRDRLAITGVAIDHAGRSAAKNVGILAAQADLVLLFDDDDIATSNLIRAHLAKHADHPEPELAVLGRTTWAPQLAVSPVMHFVTDIGMLLFSYARISSDQILDYRHFWEGRVSCKRAFLLANGLHDQRLAYTIDIELGRRLDAAGLKLVYAPEALSHMARAVTFADFARRCEAKGRAARQLSQLHPVPEVRAYCAIDEAERAYPDVAPAVNADLERLAALEERAGPLRATAPSEVLAELDQVYRRLFRAATFKGIVESGGCRPGQPVLSVVIPIWSVTQDLAAVAARTVEQIWDVARVPTEVIVIDNGSPFPRDLPVTTLVRWPENRGVAAAWNAGLRAGQGHVLAVLNSDVLVEPGWDAALVEAAAGRRIAFPFTDHCDGLGHRRPDKAGIAGWCFALSRTLFDELGPFDEQFAPAYWEDTDYWHRAHVAGVALNPVPAARVQHARRTTARHLEGFDEVFERNRRRYEHKHGLGFDEAPPYWHRRIEDHVATPDPRGG